MRFQMPLQFWTEFLAHPKRALIKTDHFSFLYFHPSFIGNQGWTNGLCMPYQELIGHGNYQARVREVQEGVQLAIRKVLKCNFEKHS